MSVGAALTAFPFLFFLTEFLSHLLDVLVFQIVIIGEHFIYNSARQDLNDPIGHSGHQGVVIGGEEDYLRKGAHPFVQSLYGFQNCCLALDFKSSYELEIELMVRPLLL